MKECPDADAIVTIADVLHWDVDGGLHHLQTCADCRGQIHMLAATRMALRAQETVDDATFARIDAAIGAEARVEQLAARRTQRRANAAEALLAAVAGPLALASSGVRVDSIPALGLTAALAVALLAVGVRVKGM